MEDEVGRLKRLKSKELSDHISIMDASGQTHCNERKHITRLYIRRKEKQAYGRMRRKMGAGWLEQEAAAVVASMNGMMLQKK